MLVEVAGGFGITCIKILAYHLTIAFAHAPGCRALENVDMPFLDHCETQGVGNFHLKVGKVMNRELPSASVSVGNTNFDGRVFQVSCLVMESRWTSDASFRKAMAPSSEGVKEALLVSKLQMHPASNCLARLPGATAL